jgi:hypothetical protein
MTVFSISVILCTLIYYQLVPIVKNNDDADDADDDDGDDIDDIDFNDEVVVVVGGASQDEPVLDMY